MCIGLLRPGRGVLTSSWRKNKYPKSVSASRGHKKISDAVYQPALARLQHDLVNLQEWVVAESLKVVVIMTLVHTYSLPGR